MNEIEKTVEEIVDNHKVLSKLQSRIVIENFPEFKKELTAYITKLLNEVVPENRVYITDEPRKDEFWKAGFNDCLNLIKQNIAKKLEEGKVDEKR